MTELFEGLLRVFFAILELFLSTVAFLLTRAATLVGWVCSKRFRERKRREWQQHALKKFAELAFSGICLAAIVGLVVSLSFFPAGHDESPAGDVEQSQKLRDFAQDLLRRFETNSENGTITNSAKAGSDIDDSITK